MIASGEEAREVADALSGLDPDTRFRTNGLAYVVAEPVNSLLPTTIGLDVAGKRLFFAAVTKPGHGIEQEMADIVKSIRFGKASLCPTAVDGVLPPTAACLSLAR